MRSRRAKKKIARPVRKAKPRTTKPRTTKPRTRKPPARKMAVARRTRASGREALAALEREVRRLRTARRKLEERLTAAVQEIGTLRHYEIRAQMLENELVTRNAEIARLREQASDRLGGASIVSAPDGASN